MIALLGTFAQINPVWLYGPYTPADISAGSQPDFYMGFLEGSLRLMPAWEFNLFGYTFAMSVLIPALVPLGIVMTGLALYPFLEQWVTGDRREHHVCDRPRNNPHRTAIGMAGITFYGVLWLLGANDEISSTFHISLYTTTILGRIAIFVGPAIAYFVAYRICIGLQRKDAEVLSHGVESGVIKRMPNGQYIEVHTPPAEDIAAHIRGKKEIPIIEGGVDGEEVPPKGLRSGVGRLRAKMSKAYGTDHVPFHEEEVEEHAAVGAGEHKQLH